MIRAAAAAAVAAALAGLTLAPAQAGLVRVSDATPIVPRNDRAYIFDTFGSEPGFKNTAASLAKIRKLLTDEHYKVTRFTGAAATLANFTKLRGAGVIVLSTHGYDPKINARDRPCPFSKGLQRVSDVKKLDPGAGKYAPEFLSCPGEALLVAQRFPDKASWIRGYVGAREAGWTTRQIFPVAGGGGIFGIGITGAGLKRVFGGADAPALIFASACYSMSFASIFGADSYFGYHSTTYDCEDGKELDGIFGRLAGMEGVDERDTASAWREGGFNDSNFQTLIKQPIVLSPAVTSVDPGPPTPPATALPLKAGSQTPLTVKFDARMSSDSPQSVVSVSGCGATVSAAKWQDDNTLSAMLNIPAASTGGQITLTIGHADATGEGSSGVNSQLDGNQSPSPDNGVEPNASDYTWTLPCQRTLYTLHVDYAGTLQDSYTVSGGGSSLSLQFDASRTSSVSFLPPLSATQGAVSLTASGSISSANGDACTLSAGATPDTLNLGANNPNSTTTGSTTTNTFTVQTGMPVTINTGQMSVSGSGDNCYAETAGGLEVQPVSFVHPGGGNYDPGGALGAAEYSSTMGVNVNSLPYTHTFPFDFTVTDNAGGSDHVSGSATVTVTEAP